MRFEFGQKIIDTIRFGRNCYAVYSDELKAAINKYNKRKNANILVENNGVDNGKCAIYFSSNGLYFPMNLVYFKRKIIKKNHFEYYKKRYTPASQHIFVRDLRYLWYQYGINNEYDSPDKVAELLKQLTQGKEVYTFGSSSGGFAAILFGTLINAKCIVASDPTIDFQLLLKTRYAKNEYAEHYKNQIFKDMLEKQFKYGNLQSLVRNTSSKIYAISTQNSWADAPQMELVKDCKSLHFIYNNFKEHGLFGINVIDDIMKLNEQELDLLFSNRFYSTPEEVKEAIILNKQKLQNNIDNTVAYANKE